MKRDGPLRNRNGYLFIPSKIPHKSVKHYLDNKNDKQGGIPSGYSLFCFPGVDVDEKGSLSSFYKSKNLSSCNSPNAN